MFNLIGREEDARIGEVSTEHGDFLTPCFMNVATAATIKGGLSSIDLESIGCQVMLSNTYHLYLRPGDSVVKELGGLNSFSGWNGPTLTDSGGFQIYSLASARKVSDNGVTFRSHIDGAELFIGPKESMRIQSNLASSIAMAFDECIDSKSDTKLIREAANRTVSWLKECKNELKLLNEQDETINKNQLLFGINQGGCDDDIRIDNMKRIVDIDLDGYAIGGLAVGETHQEMYHTISVVEEHMPREKARYLMGVGTLGNILEAIKRGVDMFDCVLPSRNGRHGHFFTNDGIINIKNKKYALDENPIDKDCNCEVCKNFSRAYIRHLFTSNELLGLRMGVYHNLYFYNHFIKKIRTAISIGEYKKFYERYINVVDQRI